MVDKSWEAYLNNDFRNEKGSSFHVALPSEAQGSGSHHHTEASEAFDPDDGKVAEDVHNFPRDAHKTEKDYSGLPIACPHCCYNAADVYWELRSDIGSGLGVVAPS